MPDLAMWRLVLPLFSSLMQACAPPPPSEFLATEDNCALGNDGRVACWSTRGRYLGAVEGNFTQLGRGGSAIRDGDVVDVRDASETLIASDAQYVQADNFCALTRAGEARCRTLFDTDCPCGALEPPSTSVFSSISASHHGGDFGCGILTDTGEISCWGGEVVLSCFTGCRLAGPVSPPAGVFRQIAMGSYHGCGIKEVDSQIVCWGNIPPDEDLGQASPPVGEFAQISAAGDTTCGLTVAGSVQCWGWDFREHVMSTWDNPDPAYEPNGCGDRYEPYVDISVLGGARYIYVSAGSGPCAVRSDGKIVCWGRNCVGETILPPGFGPE